MSNNNEQLPLPPGPSGPPGSPVTMEQLLVLAQSLGDYTSFNSIQEGVSELKSQQAIMKTNIMSAIEVLRRMNSARPDFGNLERLLNDANTSKQALQAALANILETEAPTKQEIQQAITQLRTVVANMPTETRPANDELMTSFPDLKTSAPLNGGRSFTSKKGGYGWRGERGTEVRTSIRKTRKRSDIAGKAKQKSSRKTRSSPKGKANKKKKRAGRS